MLYAVGHLAITIFSGREPWTFLESFALCLIVFGFAIRVYWLLYFRGDPSDAELFSIVRRLYVYRDLL